MESAASAVVSQGHLLFSEDLFPCGPAFCLWFSWALAYIAEIAPRVVILLTNGDGCPGMQERSFRVELPL